METDRKMCFSYLEASKLYVKLGKIDEALLCAEKALHIDEDCLGKDHDLYQDSLNVVWSLRKDLDEIHQRRG